MQRYKESFNTKKDVGGKLYQIAKEKVQRDSERETSQNPPDKCTFKPKISALTEEMRLKLQGTGLMQRAELMLLRKDDLARKTQEVVRNDPNIGAKKSKRPSHQCIYDYLYSQRDEVRKKQEGVQVEENLKMKVLRESSKSPTAENVMIRCLNDRLTKLFEFLDRDSDGYSSG